MKIYLNKSFLKHNKRDNGQNKQAIDYISKTVPELLGTTERINLGLLRNDKNLYLHDNQTAKVFGNAISYLLLRSELLKEEKGATRE